MDQENTLFYSRYCKHCRDFIIKLKQNDLLDYFTKKICIDESQIRKHLPPFLKEVPTIITEDYDQPISSDMAFKWVTFKIKDNNKQQQNNKDGKSCTISDPDCFSFNDQFGDFDSIDNNTTMNEQLKGAKQGSTGSINYDSFQLINPNQVQSNSSSGGKGDLDKNLEKLQKMREMDNNFFNTDKNGMAPMRHG